MTIVTSSFAAEIASVKNDQVNIRSGPGTNHEILWEVFKGFPLKILKRENNWAHIIDFEDDKGWIFAPLLSTQNTVIVRVKIANMRVGPSTNYEIMATVKYGVVFKPVESKGDWLKVAHEDGASGWISRELLWPPEL